MPALWTGRTLPTVPWTARSGLPTCPQPLRLLRFAGGVSDLKNRHPCARSETSPMFPVAQRVMGTACRAPYFSLPASRTPLAEHGHEHEHGHGLAHAPLSARVKAGGVLWRHRTGG
jgi:hypothetical protein